jgi:hypothetical protein
MPQKHQIMQIMEPTVLDSMNTRYKEHLTLIQHQEIMWVEIKKNLAASPTQTVLTSGRMCLMVSKIAIPVKSVQVKYRGCLTAVSDIASIRNHSSPGLVH